MNKQIPTTLGILIILILAGVVGVVIFLFSNNIVEDNEGIKAMQKDVVLESIMMEEVPNRRNVLDLIVSICGKNYAYIGTEDGNYYVILNGKKGDSYEWVSRPLFSPDGKSLAYIAHRGNKEFIVLNGEEGRMHDKKEEDYNVPFASPPLFTFSPDSQSLVYITKEDNKYILVINGEVVASHDFIKSIVFSPNGQKMAYVAVDDNKRALVINGEVVASHDFIEDPVFSPDGKSIIYGGKNREKRESFLVIDGEKQKAYPSEGTWGVRSPVFSFDGQRLAYRVEEDLSWVAEKTSSFVVVDGEEGGRYEWVSQPKFSPNNERVAYIAMEERECFVVLDEIEQQKYRAPSNGKIEPCSQWDIVFSPDSSRIAYRVWSAKEGRDNRFIVIDGEKQELNAFFISIPIFSPNSKNLGYIMRDSWHADLRDNNFSTVISGEVGDHYDGIWSLVFSESGNQALYMALKNNELWRIVEKIKK